MALNQFTPLLLRPLILTIGIRAKFLKFSQVLFFKTFLMADKLAFGEGASINNRPPLFFGVNYQFWKIRMNFFIQSTDKGIWEAIENGPFIPQVKKDYVFVDKLSSEWTESDSKKIKFYWIVKNIITSALSCDEFFRVSKCNFAKEM